MFYRNISSFKFQTYLNHCASDKIRYAFARLKVASHRLEIEAGRWKRPNPTPVNDRICKSCSLLEDEYHFVLKCVLYVDIRKQYIKK